MQNSQADEGSHFLGFAGLLELVSRLQADLEEPKGISPSDFDLFKRQLIEVEANCSSLIEENKEIRCSMSAFKDSLEVALKENNHLHSQIFELRKQLDEFDDEQKESNKLRHEIQLTLLQLRKVQEDLERYSLFNQHQRKLLNANIKFQAKSVALLTSLDI